MLKQLLFSVLCGLLCVITFVQHDPWIKELIAQHIVASSPALCAAQITCQCTDISLLQLTITLHDVYATSMQQDQQWYWRADRLHMRCSWWELLVYGTLDFCNEIDNLVVHSYLVDQQLDMAEHLAALLIAPHTAVHTFLQEATLRSMELNIYDMQHDIQAHVTADIQIRKRANCFDTTIDVYDGGLSVKQRTLFAHMGGSLQLELFTSKPHVDMCLGGAASVVIPQLGDESTPCHIKCSWQHNRGMLSMSNVDHTFVIDPIIVKKEQQGYTISVGAQVPLMYMWRMAHDNAHAEDKVDDHQIGGSCAFEVKYTQKDMHKELRGHATAQRISYRDLHIGSLAKMSFALKNDQFTGDCYMQRTSGACAGGSWQFDPQRMQGSVQLKNSSRLAFLPEHDWRILPDDATCTLQLAEHGVLNVMYDVKATHAKTNDTFVCAGTARIDDDLVALQGVLDQATFDVQLQRGASLICKHMQIMREQQALLKVEHDGSMYNGFVDVACIKEILKRCKQFNLQGEGQFNLRIKDEPERYTIDIQFAHGAIRLPRTYNFVHGFDAQLVLGKDYTVELNDLVCILHNGKITSSGMRAVCTSDFALRSWYAPILIDHCLLNMEHELFAMVSGDLLFCKKEHGGGSLQGTILLDRAQLKGNIFSDVFQKNMRSFTAHSFEATSDDQIMCDILVQTKHPIKVQTPFLVTDARIDLHVHQTLRNPALTGSVQLQGGQLNFPYRPLYVSKGALHFVPGRLEDPLIELVAKNSIKKHHIVLQAMGSLQDHHMSLESSPTLSEEQIISLLLVGSQEESLNVVMPALLMQNIKTLLFGYDQSTSTMSRYFNNFLKPFRRIHLVPSFVDRSGRGGLRGAIEIDISDRWRATIEKNFSLTEDTRFELEYLFADDVSMRVVRDIRRDVIGEVETRWKFGSP